MRTYHHIIDTKAVKYVLQCLPDNWVVRDLSERDYGIDLMVELFQEDGVDINGHQKFDATGRVCYLQIKGANSELVTTEDNKITFQIDKKALRYVEKFATPFILVRVCTIKDNEKAYFCWLQRYILNVLEERAPNWREDDKDSYAVHIPVTNCLSTNTDKINKIAGRIKYIEEAAEFIEKYEIIMNILEGIDYHDLSSVDFGRVIAFLNRIKNLSTLLNMNPCQVTKQDIEKLIEFIISIKDGHLTPTSKDDFPETLMYNLNSLSQDNCMRIELENMLAENEGDTVY